VTNRLTAAAEPPVAVEASGGGLGSDLSEGQCAGFELAAVDCRAAPECPPEHGASHALHAAVPLSAAVQTPYTPDQV
jgi:hypothetical protein